MKTISELEKELDEASAQYTLAEKAYSNASTALTSARNRLNESQKAFDAAIFAKRKAAPRGSDWTQASSGIATADERPLGS